MAQFSNLAITALVIVAIWDLIWRGIALWKAAQHRQNAWFIFLLIINSAGILPIIYIVAFQKDEKHAPSS